MSPFERRTVSPRLLVTDHTIHNFLSNRSVEETVIGIDEIPKVTNTHTDTDELAASKQVDFGCPDTANSTDNIAERLRPRCNPFRGRNSAKKRRRLSVQQRAEVGFHKRRCVVESVHEI